MRWLAPPRAPVIAGVLAALVFAAAWMTARPRVPAGDEPHYLVIAQSLLYDGDLRIENNHQQDQYLAYYDGVLKPDFMRRGVDRQIYSIHAPGVAALVLPAFAAVGYPGAVGTVIAAIAAGTAAAWLAAWWLTASIGAAWAAWLALVVSAPLVLHGYAVYPDPVGAAAVMAGVLALVALETGAAALGPRAWGLIGAALALLPWLHTRFALLAGGLGLAIVLRLRRRADASPGAGRLRRRAAGRGGGLVRLLLADLRHAQPGGALRRPARRRPRVHSRRSHRPALRSAVRPGGDGAGAARRRWPAWCRWPGAGRASRSRWPRSSCRTCSSSRPTRCGGAATARLAASRSWSCCPRRCRWRPCGPTGGSAAASSLRSPSCRRPSPPPSSPTIAARSSTTAATVMRCCSTGSARPWTSRSARPACIATGRWRRPATPPSGSPLGPSSRASGCCWPGAGPHGVGTAVAGVLAVPVAAMTALPVVWAGRDRPVITPPTSQMAFIGRWHPAARPLGVALTPTRWLDLPDADPPAQPRHQPPRLPATRRVAAAADSAGAGRRLRRLRRRPLAPRGHRHGAAGPPRPAAGGVAARRAIGRLHRPGAEPAGDGPLDHHRRRRRGPGGGSPAVAPAADAAAVRDGRWRRPCGRRGWAA